MTFPTREQAIIEFKKYINKPRTELPWLKGRLTMLDCAAGVSYVTGLVASGRDIISCGVWMQKMKNNYSWKTTGIPKRGDAVIFDWTGNKTGHDHIGIVLSATKNKVKYISADSHPKDKLVTINEGISYKWITGWGTPVPYADDAPATGKPKA
jgi:hypothetical protein